jgi:hypothetical protein
MGQPALGTELLPNRCRAGFSDAKGNPMKTMHKLAIATAMAALAACSNNNANNAADMNAADLNSADLNASDMNAADLNAVSNTDTNAADVNAVGNTATNT